MAKDYVGIKQNQNSGKWKYSLIKKGNRRVSTLKHEFDTKKEAALHRDMHILRDMLDTEKKGNERNFSDKKFKKLNKKRMKAGGGKIFGQKKK